MLGHRLVVEEELAAKHDSQQFACRAFICEVSKPLQRRAFHSWLHRDHVHGALPYLRPLCEFFDSGSTMPAAIACYSESGLVAGCRACASRRAQGDFARRRCWHPALPTTVYVRRADARQQLVRDSPHASLALAQTSTHGPWPLGASAGRASAASAACTRSSFREPHGQGAAKISRAAASPGSSASCEGLGNPEKRKCRSIVKLRLLTAD